MSFAITILLASATAWDQRLNDAVALLAKGDPAAAGRLIAVGADALPKVADYLRDPKVEVRRVAVLALGGIDGSCQLLETPLADSSAEIRGRAALALYQRCGRSAVPCARLIEGLRMPDPSAAAILLAGYCPEAKPLLERSSVGRMKIEQYGPVVPGSLVAAVSLLRLGDSSQAKRLSAAVRSRNLEETEFVLQVLPELPSDQTSLAGPLLDDRRETVVLSSAPVGAGPKRRICDVAVELLSERKGVKLPFARRQAGRYSTEELRAAQTALLAK